MKMLLLIFSFCMNITWAQTDSIPSLRGEGHYKWLFLSIYDAKLWAAPGEDIYANPLILELKYSRSFNGKDIAEQSIKELKNAGASKTDLEQWKVKLLEIFPDVKKGDTIKASYDPKKGITFYLNSNKDLGQLTDLNFSKKFLDIWLGEKTSDPELRKKLLGNKL